MLLSGIAFAQAPAECRGVLTKKIVAQATVGKVDPAAAYANKSTLPPSLRCASALWQALHPAPRRMALADADGIHREKRTPPLRIEPYTGPPPVDTVHAVKTPPLREMPLIPPPFPAEKEKDRSEPVHPQRPTDTPAPEAEPNRQRANGPVKSAPVASGISFEGVGSGLPGYQVNAVPPDTNGRVGATQYVQWNNTSFAIWDKNGTKLYGPAAGKTLFQPLGLGSVCATHNDGDPVVSYDLIAGRWVLSQLVINGGSSGFSHQCIAVSVTSDATGSWYLYDFVTDPTNFVDYPHTAVWSDGYYLAAHIFDQGGYSYLAARIYVFERDKMINGQPARMLSADLKKYGGFVQYGFLPADLDSDIPPPPGEAEFVLGPDPVSTSLVDSTRVAVTWGVTPTVTLTETQISASWGIPPCVNNSYGRDCVPQPPPSTGYDDLDNLDQHFMYRLAYRNFGGTPPQESLVANITVPGSASTPAHGAVKWFEFRNSGNSTATPTVYQSGVYDPDNDYRWMGSIAMDKDHNIALGYSRSSLTTKPSIYVNGRLGTDPLNTLGTETLMQAGGGVQYSYNRWGDYSSMTLDPVDQCTFWYTNEYEPSNGSFNWATRIAAFKFPSCTPTSWGQLTGTITTCATGTPVSGVVVTLNNGYSGATDATGKYAIAVPAGTYTVTAAAADRNCSSSSPATVSVIVGVDQIVTQDFCMTGTSNVQYKSVAIDDSANGNNNGVVNRNECVNLNVTLSNAGCANESNISGTLTTTTAGVTVTQGSSFFPNLAVSANGTSSIPFRIQTSSSFVCGTVINFTLNLSYSSGSKAVTFSVPTCGSGGSQSIPTSSLTTSDSSQPDRLYRDGNPSTCSGKTCPGPRNGGGPFYYKTFKFTNTAAVAACVTVTINAACGTNNSEIASSAYLGSTYTPPASGGDPKICNNYLGDSAIVGVTDGTVAYSFNVPASSDFVVVVNAAFIGYTCNQFSGTVTGLLDNTPGPGPCPTCTTPSTPTISAGGATTFCTGGSVTLTSSAASGNQWYRDGGAIAGATGTTVNATVTGSYTVTTTANNCTSAPSSATVVTVNPIPATPAPANSGPYCAGATIALSTPTVANATYAWTGPNGFTSSLQNPTKTSSTAADAGAYSVTVTVNGCTSAAGTTSVVVTALPSTPTAANNGPFCNGQTLNLTTPAVAGATYSWRGPNGFTSTQQNPTKASLTAADAGTYWVTVTANGCTSAGGPTDVVVNTIPSTPAAANGGPYCAGGTIALSTPAVANATYAWTGPNGFTSSLQNPTKASATAADGGTYSVTVTVNGCTSAAGTTSVTVNTSVPATPAANNAGPYCEGGTIALSTPTVAGATYAWTGPNGFTSALQNPTKANAAAADGGTYSVTVTVGGCTSAAGTTSVVVNAKPATPTASNGGPYCEGSTISLSTPTVTGATYAWTGPNGFTSTLQNPTKASAAAADFGTYSVTVTVNGCTSAVGTTTVIDGNGAAVATNGGPYCVGGTITLSTPAVSGATYAWSGPNSFSSTAQNPTVTTNAAVSDAGTYSVIVTAPGCTSTAGTTSVVVNTTPATPTATNGGPYCEGGTIALSTPTVAGATYAWTGPNGFTSTQQNPTIAAATVASAGTYSVTLFNGCTSAAGTTTVVINSAPATPTATNSGPVCGGGTIALFTPTVSGATYAWTGPNGFTSTLQNPTKANAVAADAGTYSVTITVNGCASAAGTTSVVVNTLVTPAPSNGGPYCEGATVSLSTPAVAGATYAWTGPNGFSSTSRTPTITFAAPSASGAYSVTVTANSCTSAAGTTNVVVNAFPAKPAAANSGPYCAGGTIALSTPTVTGATYAWTGPNGFTSTQQNPTKTNIAVADAGTYSVSITVNGCTSAVGTTTVVVNATPATPAATNTGPYCAGGAISLSTPYVVGASYAWTGPNGFTSTQRTPYKTNIAAADAGTYSVVITVAGCPSAAGTTSVVINPTPAAPTISAGGATSFCTGGNVVLTSSIATGNQWLLNGSPINGATNQTYTATVGGSYTAVVASGGCTSAASNSIPVTVTQQPNATIGAGSTTYPGATYQYAYSYYYYSGATYAWTITNGTIVSGATSSTMYYTAGPAGAVTLQLTITTAPGCSDTKTATVHIVPSISTIAPTYGRTTGGTNVTITGAGFQNGATVKFGGTAATNVVTTNSTSIAATSPAHAAGSVSILVTNPDGYSYSTSSSSFTYLTQFFDPNGDHAIDASDIFYLVNYLFTSGPAPKGQAGMLSGDANGDNVVDPSDIFYAVNYIFTGGPAPKSVQPHNVAPLSGSVTLGEPVVRGGRTFVPVIVDGSPGALSMRVRASGGKIVAVRRAGAARDLHPLFETTPTQPDGIAYLVSFGAGVNGVVAELEVAVPAGAAVDLGLDPELTMLTDRSGEEKATVANGRLRLAGTTIGRERPASKPGN